MNRTYSLSGLSPYVLILLLATISLLQGCTSQSKPAVAQWRGDHRDGIYNETNLLAEWPENGPELLWVYEGIGKGYAAPSVLNNTLFVNGEQDSTSYLFALDLSGNLRWKSPNGPEFMGEGFSATYPGSRSTPTVVGDLVYASSGQGRLACFNAKTGEEKWAVDLAKDLGGEIGYFGYSESPVVDDGKVFCFPAGTTNNTVALDQFSGEKVWSSEAMQDTFSYCSPILVELSNRKALITHSRHYMYVLDTENGNMLGSSPLDYKYDGEHCNSPVFSDGAIYFISNEKKDGALKLELSADGMQMNRIWSNPKIRNNFNGYVKVGNHFFTTIKGNWLKALDLETGLATDSVNVATGSLIYADNKFICYGMNGTVSLITYMDNDFEVKSTFKVEAGDGQHFAHPVVSNGVMYIRHGNALLAYKIAKT